MAHKPNMPLKFQLDQLTFSPVSVRHKSYLSI